MDGHAVFVLVEARHSVAPANVCAQLLRALGEELHKSGLLDGDHIVLGIRRPRQIQRQSRKHGPRRRLRWVIGPRQDAVETSMVENPNPLARGSGLGPGNGSNTIGRIPASASSQATIRPLGPAPAMTTSFI